MILRRYGASVRSVETNFDSRALTEVGFRRTDGFEMPAEAFFEAHERLRGHELTAATDGRVQDETEARMLDELQVRLRALVAELGPDEVLLVESEVGKDYPRTHTRHENVVEEGENRIHFHVNVDPPLRVAVYRRVAPVS